MKAYKILVAKPNPQDEKVLWRCKDKETLGSSIQRFMGKQVGLMLILLPISNINNTDARPFWVPITIIATPHATYCPRAGGICRS